jgi:hypothetical protein
LFASAWSIGEGCIVGDCRNNLLWYAFTHPAESGNVGLRLWNWAASTAIGGLEMTSTVSFPGDSEFDPIFANKVEDNFTKIGHGNRPGHRHSIPGTFYKGDYTNKFGVVTGRVVYFVPDDDGIGKSSVTDSAGSHPGDLITDIYWMSLGDGKPPKISQIGDPDLTLLSMTTVAVDPEAEL